MHAEAYLADDDATAAAGAALAAGLAPGMLITLAGPLGAGKTALVRSVLRARGVTGPIKSPTYTLVEVYAVSSLYFYHFDFYRVGDAEELAEVGLRDYFRRDSICLVEWPERAGRYLPPADVAVELAFDDGARRLRLAAGSARGQACVARFLKGRTP